MKKRYERVFEICVCAVAALIGFGIGKVVDVWQDKETPREQRWEDKVPEPAKSGLLDKKQCWLCGDSNRSLMGYFRKFDDLGVICVNNWYVLDMNIRNQDEYEGLDGGTRSGFTGTGEGGCSFSTEQTPSRGISKVSITQGEDGIFDVRKVKDNLCQTCLDKLLETMETYGAEDEEAAPKDLCLVDFQTLELYPLQEHNRSYFIRDYYVQIENGDEKTEVFAFYAPELKNGEKPGE